MLTQIFLILARPPSLILAAVLSVILLCRAVRVPPVVRGWFRKPRLCWNYHWWYFRRAGLLTRTGTVLSAPMLVIVLIWRRLLFPNIGNAGTDFDNRRINYCRRRKPYFNFRRWFNYTNLRPAGATISATGSTFIPTFGCMLTIKLSGGH